MCEIAGAEKLCMETRDVAQAFERQSEVVKMVTPGTSGKPAEIVMLKLGRDGSLQSLKLGIRSSSQHPVKFITCGDLLEKP